MKLENISAAQCPICGCDAITEEKVERESYSLKLRQHTNGGRWESRTFSCGQRLEYCPNFCTVDLSKSEKCTNNNQYKLALQREQIFKDKVREFIESYDDVTETCKARMLYKIK